MRIYFLLILSISIFSCNSKTETTKNTPIGFEISNKGEKLFLTAGEMSSVAIWEKYIDAHNNRNIEDIKSMNADDIKIYGPRGEYIEGSKAHEEFLKVWFSTNNPKWSPKYYIANDVINTDGNNTEHWVTSSLNLSLIDGDKVLKVVQIHDALISDGKVKKFYVYERLKQDNEE
jgi:hypothetical protein